MPNMTPTQQAEAVALYNDAKIDAAEHAREFLNDLGASRQHLATLTHKLAVAFVACEMFVEEAEVEAVLNGEGVQS